MTKEEEEKFAVNNYRVGVIEKSQIRVEERQIAFHAHINEKFDDYSTQNDLISFHLLGDPKAGTRGWIFKVDKFTSRLSKVERRLYVLGSLFLILVVKGVAELF